MHNNLNHSLSGPNLAGTASLQKRYFFVTLNTKKA